MDPLELKRLRVTDPDCGGGFAESDGADEEDLPLVDQLACMQIGDLS
ncbi:hypothetical protein [Streptomyces sp. NPDC005538]